MGNKTRYIIKKQGGDISPSSPPVNPPLWSFKIK